MFDVLYYQEKSSFPVVDFVSKQQPKIQAKILREIDLLSEFGFALGMPHIRKMSGTDDLWELRIKHSSNYFRIFYFYFKDNKFVLLHGIRKTTSKTPARDISIAHNRKKKYQKGCG